MFQKLIFDREKVYPTFVVSTMSSGKSTLINALAGQEIMPSSNQACTARALAILDNDRKEKFIIHAVDSKGEYTLIPNADKKIVTEFNAKSDASEMIIEGDIKGIKNSKKTLFLIDTPGINNSMNCLHGEITRKTLDEYAEGLILYVMNAEQLSTYDNQNFLYYIAEKIKNNKKFNVIFAVNKMDSLDPEEENPYELISSCREMIECEGIYNPVIIPVSARCALIFKKVLNGEHLTEMEEEEFSIIYKMFKNESYSLANYSYLPENGNMKDIFCVDGRKYSRAGVLAALHNTGLPLLESIIDETLVDSLVMKPPKIEFLKNIKHNI